MNKYAIRDTKTGEILKLDVANSYVEEDYGVTIFSEYSLEVTDGTGCEWMTTSINSALYVLIFCGNNELTTPSVSKSTIGACEIIECATDAQSRIFHAIDPNYVKSVRDLCDGRNLTAYDFNRVLAGMEVST